MFDLIRPYFTSLYMALALLFFVVVNNYAAKLLRNHRIRRLGSRAPIRTTYLPYGIDFLYQILQYLWKDENFELWQKTFDEYAHGGATVESDGAERMIMTADPENIKAILATQFNDFGKGEPFRLLFHDFLGNGIFTTDGERWHRSRQLIRPQFIKDRISDLDIFEEHSRVLLDKLGGKQEVEFLDLMFRYTLDAATHFLLGKSVESLRNPQTAFADAFFNVQRIQGMIARIGPLSWMVPRKRMGFWRDLDTVNSFIDQYVQGALSLSTQELEEKTSRDSGYTFLHAIAAYTRDPSMLRDQLVSVLLAGRDTTACTLTWAMYELSLQPAVTAKLRKEIIDRVGLDRAPTYQDLKDMKYLQHVINETLRLYPSVPFNIRMALVDTTLPTGGGPDRTSPIGILKDTPIAYSTLVMQRRPDLYPPPASGFPPVDRFVPERWDAWTPKTWTYIPFNGGPRICIGMQFALTEMGYTLVRLLQRFERVENRMQGELPLLHADIVLQPAKEIKLAFF